jgi:hypothetical protein
MCLNGGAVSFQLLREAFEPHEKSAGQGAADSASLMHLPFRSPSRTQKLKTRSIFLRCALFML